MTILQGYLYTDVAQASTVTINYPAGFSPDTFDKAGAKACLLSVNSSLPDGSYSLAWGGSSVVVTNLSGVWKGGVSLFISVPDVANGQGEIVRATTDLTGKSVILDPATGLPMDLGGSSSNPLFTKPVICAWMGNSIVDNGDTLLKELQTLSGGRLFGKYNFGRAGISTLGMLSYIDADLVACADASVVFISEGSNDATSYDVPQVYDRVMDLVSRVKAAGKTVVLCASPPRYSSGNAYMLPRTIDFCWLYYKVSQDTDSLFVDPWYDWRGTDGKYVTGYSTDNTHAAFNDLYLLAAKRVWDTLAFGNGRPPTLEVLSDSRSAGLSQVIAGRSDGLPGGNALMLAGASTQWVGSTTGGTANVVITSESAAPFRGNQIKLDFTGGITGGVYSFTRIFSNSGSPNKPLNAKLLAKAVVGASNLSGAQVSVFHRGVSTYATTIICDGHRMDFARNMYTSDVVLTGATGGDSRITVEIAPVDGGTATGIITISNAEIYNLLSFGGV